MKRQFEVTQKGNELLVPQKIHESLGVVLDNLTSASAQNELTPNF